MCLESLRGCARVMECDILVVDNNSTDKTREVTEFYLGTLPLRYVFEPVQGLSVARNRGLREATTEWVAFLDDDAKAHVDWVATILDTIGKGDFDAFGGPYYAWHYFGPAPEWYPDFLGTYDPPHEYGLLDTAIAYIPGGNCAVKIASAQAAGEFPVELGMSGEKCAYGEESALFAIMAKSGCQLGFVPAMQIDHCVLEYKYSFVWLVRSYFARGSAEYATRGSSRVLGRMTRQALTCMVAVAKLGCRILWGLASRFDENSKKSVAAQILYSVFAFGGLWAFFSKKNKDYA